MIKDHKYSPLESDFLDDYNKNRLKNKNSVFDGVTMIIKSDIGIGFFFSQYYLGKCGFIPAIFISIICVLLINYFLYYVGKLASQVEEEKQVKIESYADLVNIIMGRTFSVITKFIVMLFNISLVYTILMTFSRFMAEKGMSFFPYEIFHQLLIHKLIFLVIVFLITILFVEPEKIRIASQTSLILYTIAISAVFIFTIKILFKEGPAEEVFFSDNSYFINAMSEISFAIESIPIIFSVRSTMKKSNDISKVLKYVTIIVVLLFILNFSIFLLVM